MTIQFMTEEPQPPLKRYWVLYVHESSDPDSYRQADQSDLLAAGYVPHDGLAAQLDAMRERFERLRCVGAQFAKIANDWPGSAQLEDKQELLKVLQDEWDEVLLGTTARVKL